MKSNRLICFVLILFIGFAAGCARDVEVIKVRLVGAPENYEPYPVSVRSGEPILPGWLTAGGRLANCLSLYRDGQYDSCRVSVENHLAETPSDWEGHYLLSLIEFKAGDFAGAERCLQTALRFSPADAKTRAVVYLTLGQTTESQGKTGLSKQHYLTALNLDAGLLPAREGLNRLTTLTSRGEQ